MSFHKEKYKWERQILMYEIILGLSSISDKGLEKVS